MRVLAQEKSLPKVESRQQTKNVISVEIDKNSTDAEIKKYAEMLKNEYGVTLKISKVKRNSKGEITAIKVEYKDKDGRKGTSQTESDSPIQPIHFFKEMDENGKGAIGFGAPKEYGHREGLAKFKTIKHLNEDSEEIQVVLEGEEDSFNWSEDFDIPSPPDAPALEDAPAPPDAPGAPKVPGAPKMKKKNVVIRQDGNKKEVWVNGEKVTEEVLGNINSDDISNVYVYNTNGEKGPKGIKGSKKITDEEIEVIHDGDKKIVIVSKDKDGKGKRTIETIDVRKVMDETKAEMERIRPEIEQAQKEAMEARKKAMEEHKEAMKAHKEAMEAHKEAMKEREKALIEAQKAREEAAKARK